MKTLISILIFLLIFISSLFIVGMSTYPYDIEGFSHGAQLIVLFGIFLIMTTGYLKLFDQRLSSKAIKIAILVPLALVIIGSTIPTSLTNTIKISPSYITIALGFLAGGSLYENGFKIKKQILFALFPIIMSFSLYDLWRHRIEYGNFDGVVENVELVQFEFVNKNNQTVSSEDLKGKVVWLDFWFIGCPPCWKAFPEVQKVYLENKENPSFAMYAVNRGDDPERLFSRIEEKGYTFPVLRGTTESLSNLGVNVYPTIILLNKKGEIIFKGEIEEAKSMLNNLLNY